MTPSRESPRAEACNSYTFGVQVVLILVLMAALAFQFTILRFGGWTIFAVLGGFIIHAAILRARQFIFRHVHIQPRPYSTSVVRTYVLLAPIVPILSTRIAVGLAFIVLTLKASPYSYRNG